MGLRDLNETSHPMDGLAKTAPGPRGSLLFGSLKEFQSDSIGFMTDSVQQYGDIVRFRFGYVVAYLVNRPEYVEQVLVRGSKNYDKNTRSVAKLRATCGNSLLSSDGQPWLRHRRLMQPMFQPQSLAAFAPAIESSTRAWIDQWDAKADGDDEQNRLVFGAKQVGNTLPQHVTPFFRKKPAQQKGKQLGDAPQDQKCAGDTAHKNQCFFPVFDEPPAEAKNCEQDQ